MIGLSGGLIITRWLQAPGNDRDPEHNTASSPSAGAGAGTGTVLAVRMENAAIPDAANPSNVMGKTTPLKNGRVSGHKAYPDQDPPYQ